MTGRLFSQRRLDTIFRVASLLCALAVSVTACTTEVSTVEVPIASHDSAMQNFSVNAFSVYNEWQQGSLIKGKTLPGAQVSFLDNDVYVNEQGEFILGLGRDAPARVDVIVTDPGGEKHIHSFDVVQRQYKIQRVEGVEEKFVTPSEEDQKRIDHENVLIGSARRLRDKRADFADGFQWPLMGPIAGVYGSQRFYNGEGRQPHYGVDIVAPVGTLVKAPAAGKITFAYDMYYSGWTLVIDHGQGLSSSFLHLSKVLVKVGDSVKQGDVVAEVGATGRVTGAHLDWRMNWLDQRIDPQLLVTPMPSAEPDTTSVTAPPATE